MLRSLGKTAEREKSKSTSEIASIRTNSDTTLQMKIALPHHKLILIQ